MKPVRARLPVSAMRRSSPMRSSISAHSAAVRWSFQRIAGRRTSPRSSRQTRPCIWPDRPTRPSEAPSRVSAASLARHQSSGSCSAQPGCGVESAVTLLRRRDHLALGGDGERLDAGRADVEADETLGHAPSAAYTSSYARTASLRCCASRSAASSIFAAIESMKRHCRTLRFTASTASSVYG